MKKSHEPKTDSRCSVLTVESAKGYDNVISIAMFVKKLSQNVDVSNIKIHSRHILLHFFGKALVVRHNHGSYLVPILQCVCKRVTFKEERLLVNVQRNVSRPGDFGPIYRDSMDQFLNDFVGRNGNVGTCVQVFRNLRVALS